MNANIQHIFLSNLHGSEQLQILISFILFVIKMIAYAPKREYTFGSMFKFQQKIPTL
jgi:hypothetical protein